MSENEVKECEISTFTLHNDKNDIWYAIDLKNGKINLNKTETAFYDKNRNLNNYELNYKTAEMMYEVFTYAFNIQSQLQQLKEEKQSLTDENIFYTKKICTLTNQNEILLEFVNYFIRQYELSTKTNGKTQTKLQLVGNAYEKAKQALERIKNN